MFDICAKVLSVKGSMSTSAFAREIGMQQKTVDLYLKGERKPSVEFIRNICSRFSVSSDWLLGLPPPGGGSVVAPNNSGAIAAGPNATATVGTGPAAAANDCATCKYKRLAEVIKAAL